MQMSLCSLGSKMAEEGVKSELEVPPITGMQRALTSGHKPKQLRQQVQQKENNYH